MSDKISTIEETTRAARVAVIAALGSIHKAERELLGAREALVGALETLERQHKPFVFTKELDRASPPDRTEKHGDILVDGVKIDFDRQVAPTEPTEKHGDILVDGVKIDFDRQVVGGVKDVKGSSKGVVKELKGKEETDPGDLTKKLKEAGAEVEVK
jgi:hypothetical protein